MAVLTILLYCSGMPQKPRSPCRVHGVPARFVLRASVLALSSSGCGYGPRVPQLQVSAASRCIWPCMSDNRHPCLLSELNRRPARLPIARLDLRPSAVVFEGTLYASAETFALSTGREAARRVSLPVRPRVIEFTYCTSCASHPRLEVGLAWESDARCSSPLLPRSREGHRGADSFHRRSRSVPQLHI